MAIIDIEKLLAEIAPDAPCGEEIEYDADFLTLQGLLARAKEDVGAVAKEGAEEVDWRGIANLSLELLARSRDIRVILALTVAALKLDRFRGLCDGLALLRGALERYWDTLYPPLDPDDGDPTERVNAVTSLVQPEGNFRDPMKFIRRIREAPLCESKQLRAEYSLRDIQIARGEVSVAPDPDNPSPDLGRVEAVFRETDTEALQATAQGAAGASEQVKKIDELMTDRVGADRAVDLGAIRSVLDDVCKEVQAELSNRGYGAPVTDEEAAAIAQEGAAGAATGPALSGEIRSKDDVLAAIDKICRYYEIHEPSSPVPLLMRRARRLVPMSFIEIIQNLSPNAMSQIELICGLDTGTGEGVE